MAYIKFQNKLDTLKGTVIRESKNLVTLRFEDEVFVSDKGFDVFLDSKCERNLGGKEYHLFTTIYRNDEETAKYNGYQLSSDGSVYEEVAPVIPTKSITVSVAFDDLNDTLGIRPESILVSVYKDSELLEMLVLDESNEWRKTYTDVPMDDVYTIEPEEVEKYERVINGTTVTYRTEVPVAEEISTNELADAMTEIVDMITAHDETLETIQDAILELTELVEGGN